MACNMVMGNMKGLGMQDDDVKVYNDLKLGRKRIVAMSCKGAVWTRICENTNTFQRIWDYCLPDKLCVFDISMVAAVRNVPPSKDIYQMVRIHQFSQLVKQATKGELQKALAEICSPEYPNRCVLIQMDDESHKQIIQEIVKDLDQ